MALVISGLTLADKSEGIGVEAIKMSKEPLRTSERFRERDDSRMTRQWQRDSKVLSKSLPGRWENWQRACMVLMETDGNLGVADPLISGASGE